MSLAFDLAAAILIVLFILVLASFIWDKKIGLTEFGVGKGGTGSWSVPAKKDISDLRFQQCIFTVTLPNKTVKSVNVSSVLNGMAEAYVGSINIPKTLNLIKPLNPFSFVIKGFNDVATVPDPSTPMWKNATVTLGGKYRVL